MDAQQQIIIALVSAFAIGFMVWIVLLKNFTINYLKVKFSGGKKLLVKVVSPAGDYYTAGQFDKGHVTFPTRKRVDNKDPRRTLFVESFGDAIYHSFGVTCIDVDDLKDSIYYRHSDQYHSIPGYNSEYFDELLKTAVAKPSEEGIGLFNAKTWQAIILIAILILSLGLFMVYKTGKDTADRQLMLHDEHVTIAYELNLTKSLLEKRAITTTTNTGVEMK